jgi:hypothetical protein
MDKANKILDTLVNYSNGGVMKRREWLEMMKSKGAVIEIASRFKYKYSRDKFNSFTNQKLQDEYYDKMQERVREYRIYDEELVSFWAVTKTEFDYYNSI